MKEIEDFFKGLVDMKVDQRMAEFISGICLESDPNRFMTIKETGNYLKVSTRTIHNYFDSGVLTKIKIGPLTRVDKMEIIEFANLQKVSRI